MPASLLEVEEITGGYSRTKPVIRDISFEVRAGEMVGLIGLNGAGKSTTIKHVLGLLEPFRGAIRFHGRPIGEAGQTFRQSVAYVPESPLVYEELTVEDHLQLSARVFGLTHKEYRARVAKLAERFDMAPHLRRFPQHLSKGMRQKIMIMNAFLVEPQLYIIDEPFLGLDPIGIRSLLDLMRERKEAGAAIFMSSHILSAIEKYCDRFLVLDDGRLIADGNVSRLRELAGVANGSLDDVFYELIRKKPYES